MATEERHFGKWLRGRIELSGHSKQSAARHVGVQPVTLRAWFQDSSPGMRPENKVNLAKFLGLTVEEINERLRRGQVLKEIVDGITPAVGEATDAIEDLLSGSGISNVEPYSEEAVDDVPCFEADLAAGAWTDVGEHAVCDPRQIEHGRFRVRLRGDSMTPDYKDGQIVEFHCVRPSRDGLIAGKDYYIQRSDGTATFKRVEEFSDEEIVLRALNRKKFPRAMKVLRADVVRMARARGIWKPID